MFAVSQKIICLDDKFPLGIEKFYTSLPKKDVIYVVRDVVLGCNYKGDAGEVCIYLVGLYNPQSKAPPFPERGFNAERFAPLNEKTDEEIEENFDLVSIEDEVFA